MTNQTSAFIWPASSSQADLRVIPSSLYGSSVERMKTFPPVGS
jgi:hypothetical protein